MKRFSYQILITLALMIFSCASLKAGTVTHALLTDSFIRQSTKFNDSEKKAFRAGVLFGNIHLLKKISKEETYFPNVTLNDVLSEPSPFIAGMMFNSFLHDLHDQFVAQSNDINQLFSQLNIAHPDIFLFFVEDEIVYTSLDKNRWKDVVKNIRAEEREWGLDEEVLKRWHYLMDLSFSHYPGTLLFLAFMKGNGILGVPHEEVSYWINVFYDATQNDVSKTFVTDLFKMYTSQLKPN